MTTDLPRYDDDATAVVDEDATEEPTSPKGLRANLDAANARIRELESQVETDAGDFRARSMSQAFDAIGLDPNKAVGKAIAVTFTGEPEDLRQYALDEFGHEYGGPAHPMAAAISLGNAQLDQIGNVAESFMPPQSREERLSEARASGDFASEGRIMAAQMQDMVDRQNRP